MRRQIKKFKMASFDMLTPMPSRTEMPMLKAQIVRWDGVTRLPNILSTPEGFDDRTEFLSDSFLLTPEFLYRRPLSLKKPWIHLH